jgi:hypothetical protein
MIANRMLPSITHARSDDGVLMMHACVHVHITQTSINICGGQFAAALNM